MPSRSYDRVKRVTDVAAAAGGLVLTAPLLAAIAVAVRRSMGPPVLFRQERSGKNGVPFGVMKFRTMRNLEQGETLFASDEVRLTPLGRRLRAWSLDELPQLLNVLRGEMSLVGPRPLPAAYLGRYSARQRRRLEVTPGITGWAQINGRNEVGWRERFELDVWYVEHASLALDLRILVRTVRQVLAGDGVSAAGHVTMPEFLGESTQDPASSA